MAKMGKISAVMMENIVNATVLDVVFWVVIFVCLWWVFSAISLVSHFVYSIIVQKPRERRKKTRDEARAYEQHLQENPGWEGTLVPSGFVPLLSERRESVNE